MNNIHAILFSCLAFFILTFATEMQAQTTVSLNPAKDNCIYESSTGALSNGVGDQFIAGKTNQGMIRRGLLQFDLSNIPAGSTIESVSLEMNAIRARNGSQMLSLHAALKDWGEGTSNATTSVGKGAAATTGDATWIHAFNSTDLWATAGGDFNNTPSSSLTVSSTGATIWSGAGLARDVQDWLENPETNFGWFVVGNEASNKSTVHFSSREGNSSPVLTVTYTEPANMAKVQIIHNAADPAAALVDIYVNGDLNFNDFAFRTATSFVELPANEELQIAVAPSTSTDASQALRTFNITLDPNETYIAMATGVINPSQFDETVNDNIGFNLYIFAGARETAANTPLETDLLAFHGVTDAPAVGVSTSFLGVDLPVVDSLAFANFTPEYSSIPAAIIQPGTLLTLDVFVVEDGTVVNSYTGDLSVFNGAAITIFASGFLDPAANQDGAAFGLFIADAAGEVFVVEEAINTLDFPKLEQVEIFPNPAADVLNISASALSNKPVNIELFTMDGKLVRGIKAIPASGNLKIEVLTENLSAGNYVLKVIQDEKITVEKVVIE